MPEETKQVDHRHLAEGRLSRAIDLTGQTGGRDRYIPVALAEAQVHATLAVAVELRGIREALGEYLGDDSYLDKLASAVWGGLNVAEAA